LAPMENMTMANTSLKRIRTFIEMYEKQDELQVQLCLDPGLSSELYVVTHKLNDKDSNEYSCKTLRAAAECVNDIIFDIDMGDRAVPAK